MNMERLLTITDIMKIFGVSQVTVYRWIALARQGQHRFPLPIGDYKQKLRWSREVIAAYQNASNPSVPKIESASERSKRNKAALASLRARGVNVTPKGEEQ